jgi:hypothetical protein
MRIQYFSTKRGIVNPVLRNMAHRSKPSGLLQLKMIRDRQANNEFHVLDHISSLEISKLEGRRFYSLRRINL